ncbi:MAG: hypothetical protein AB7E55_07850 [Pigmentiphaga sp.]
MAISSSPGRAGRGKRLAAIVGLAIGVSLLVGADMPREAAVRPPLGWDNPDTGQGCWLHTLAAAPGDRRPWRLGLGHVPQHASLFFVSLAHPGLARSRLRGQVRAWVVVDGVAMQAAGVALSGGELLVPVTYQRAWIERLASARSLGVMLESGPWSRRTVLAHLPLGNSGAVVKWLEACRR